MKLKNIGVDDVNETDQGIEIFLCNKKGKKVSLIFKDKKELSDFIKELQYIIDRPADMTSF